MSWDDEMGGKPLLDEPPRDFEPLPAGWYDVLIAEAQDKKTKAGNGAYLNFRLDVEGPTHAGRVVWALHLYRHPNDTAQTLGLSKLHALATAMGRTALPKNLMSWSGNRVQVKLRVKAAANGFEAGNEVVDYRARPGGAPTGKSERGEYGPPDDDTFPG